MTTQRDHDIKEAYVLWMDDAPVSISATLTFKSKVAGEYLNSFAAHEACRIFCRRLNCIAYRNRFKRGEKQLAVFAVREGGEGKGDKRIHYHLRIEIPSGWNARDWIAVAEREWSKLDWAGKENEFATEYSSGWLWYMLKFRDKPSFVRAD